MGILLQVVLIGGRERQLLTKKGVPTQSEGCDVKSEREVKRIRERERERRGRVPYIPYRMSTLATGGTHHSRVVAQEASPRRRHASQTRPRRSFPTRPIFQSNTPH